MALEAESSSSYSTLYLVSVGRNNPTVAHSGVILTGGGYVLVIYKRVGYLPPKVAETQKLCRIYVWPILQPVARTRNSCCSGRSFHFKKGEKLFHYRANIYLVETSFSPM